MLDLVEKQIAVFIEDLHSIRIKDKVSKLPHGKRVRAKLVLKIAGVNKQSIKLAAIIELIHGASLLHDDVIDDSNTRRGEDSLNAIYGNKTAIMLGDILYSKAFNELCSFDKEIATTISNSVTLLSIGELEDVELGVRFNDNEQKYISMIYNKTASLIEATCKASAILTNKNKLYYAQYGKNLGLAFQVVDDILDITADKETIGKPILNDFVEGKTTLPYIFMYEALNTDDQKILLSYFSKQLNTQEQKWIKTKMKDTNALEKTKKIAMKYSLEAIKNIDDETLKDIVLQMVDRDY